MMQKNNIPITEDLNDINGLEQFGYGDEEAQSIQLAIQLQEEENRKS